MASKGWLLALAGLFCCHLIGHAQSTPPSNGILDLRNHDWGAAPSLELTGNWEFYWKQWLYSDSATAAHSSPIAVPQAWGDESTVGKNFGFGTYRLQVLLGRHHPPALAIGVDEFLTAYEVEVNGQLLGGLGKIGEDARSAVPAFSPKVFAIHSLADTLDILIRGSNFDHRHGGMMQSPRLGTVEQLETEGNRRGIIGGILIGLLLMSSVYQFMHYFQGRKDLANLLSGTISLIAGIHCLFLHDRLMYQLLAPIGWEWCYKLELSTLFLLTAIGFEFLATYFRAVTSRWLRNAVLAIFFAQILFTIVAPIALAAQTDRIFPFEFLGFLLLLIGILVAAMRKKVEGTMAFIVATLVFIAAAMTDRLLFGLHVGSLLPTHFFLAAYLFSFSWILSRRAAATERKAMQLSIDLQQSNAALEIQNQNLESVVEQRTAELVQAQKEAHELEMDQVQRDIETLSANNQMKMQLTRNLVEELQDLLHAGGDYQTGLKSLISGLRGQMATEERLEVLQEDLALVNAEFYRRLQAKYPQLSKTEREICAYMKLNLSGKDIAMLRKTSISTINVARHRIRKKLALERDEELQAVIQQL